MPIQVPRNVPPEPPPPTVLPKSVYVPGDPVALRPDQLVNPPGPIVYVEPTSPHPGQATNPDTEQTPNPDTGVTS